MMAIVLFVFALNHNKTISLTAISMYVLKPARLLKIQLNYRNGR